METTAIPYGDIIVIGAIAAFILLRYRAMLGEKSGRETPPPSRPRAIPEYERIVQVSASPARAVAEEKKDELPDLAPALADKLSAMRLIDRGFTRQEFLDGAKIAYEMVISAFTKADRATLKTLLAPCVYTTFERALTQEESQGVRTETTLAAISEAQIVKAELNGNVAVIGVQFVSEQIHLKRNAAGEVIEGNPSRMVKVSDRWSFLRNLASSDPNWSIIET